MFPCFGLLALVLALTAASSSSADRSSSAEKPSNPCATASALRRAGETAQARKAYVAVLESEPSSECAQQGLAQINAPPTDPAAADCARGKTYLRVGRDEDATAAFESALEKDPNAECAERGLDEAKSAAPFVDELEDAAADAASFLSSALVFLGLAAVAVFALLLLGYLPILRGGLRRLPIVGRLLGPRLTIEKPEDDAVDGKPGAAIAARVKERLQRMREEAIVADGAVYELDRSTPSEDFADVVSESSGLKNSLENASDISDQTKVVAAVLNLLYAALPIPRLSVSAALEPPEKAGAAATLLLEKDGRLEAATTLRGPALPEGEAKAPDYCHLADPAAVWAEYEVGRVLANREPEPHAAESYARVREGLEFQMAGVHAKARDLYLKAIKLNRRNWAAYVNLAVTEAWLASDYERSIVTLRKGLEEIEGVP